LFIGKQEEALAYNNRFESTIAKRLGYPSLKPLGITNLAEGVVIKPMKEIAIRKSEKAKTESRAIIKNKIPEFSEDRRFHQAEKWDASSSANINNKQSSSSSSNVVEMLSYEAMALVSEQRLHNAISKIGRVTKADKERLRALFVLYVDDVRDQIRLDYEEEWSQLSQNEQEAVIQTIKREAEVLFRDHFGLNSKK